MTAVGPGYARPAAVAPSPPFAIMALAPQVGAYSYV